MTRRDLIFRVFVSSTFNDLIEERNALQAQDSAFANLRKYCQERGARFQAIDLRWGISAEAGLDQQTMFICLQELARCQELSPRPNFILLLGNRYGWRPLPARVEAGEYEQLLGQVSDPDKALLTTDQAVPAWRDGQPVNRTGWYRKDLNAAPLEYVLQPRTIEFPDQATDDVRMRIRQEEALAWSRLEARMRGLLLGAIAKLGWSAGDPRRFKYEASATHQEIQAGAMKADNPHAHVFCYFREIDRLPENDQAATYRDISGGAVDLDAQNCLTALKIELGGNDQKEELLPRDHVHRYRAWWQNGHPEYDRRDLCADVERDLKAVIDREIAAFQQKPALELEREAHHDFAAEHCQHFVGRRDLLERIQTYIGSDDKRPLVVYGKSGSGKTAVMAKASEECESREAKGRMKVIARFVGATPGSSDLRTLLGDLCRELGVSEIPQDMNDLVRTFRAQLSAAEADGKADEAKPEMAEQGKVVLFLDALDQLNPTDNARMLYWLPRELKPNVKLVISVLETERIGEEPGAKKATPSAPQPAVHTPEDPFDLAGRIWPQSLVEVGPLDGTSAAGLLDAWLQEAGRRLQSFQRQEVLAKFAKCPLPLYLKLAAQEACRWKSWAAVTIPLSDSVDGLLEQMLARLERPSSHGATLVSRALSYIDTGKNGLTEDELIDVLSADQEVLEWFYAQSPTEQAKDPVDRIKSLPVVIWSRLFADIQPYMTRRRADGTVVMDFYHRQVGEAVRKRYLATGEARVQAHQHLAEYFHKLDYWAESLEAQRARAKRLPPTPRPVNVRKVVELPYHRLEVAKLAGKDDPKFPYWDAVADLLTDWQFLEAKAEADPNFQELESVVPAKKASEANQ